MDQYGAFSSRENPSSENEVLNPGADLCKNYNIKKGCTSVKCPVLHLCQYWVGGDCKFGPECKRSHQITNVERMKIRDAGFSPDDPIFWQRIREKLKLKKTYRGLPSVCSRYTSRKGCERGGECLYIHLCKHSVSSNCTRGLSCPYEHRLSEKDAAIIRNAGFRGPPEELLQAYIQSQQNSSSTSTGQKQPIASDLNLKPKEKSYAEKWRTGVFQKLRLESSRELNFNDSRMHYFRIAECQFLRGLGSTRLRASVESVDLFINPVLEAKYHTKRQNLKRDRGEDFAKEILAFHGTPLKDPDPIMKDNFSLDKIQRTRHGFGVYFSEFPDVAINYAGGERFAGSLIMARVLIGKQIEARSCPMMQIDKYICKEHDSHLVNPQEDNYSQMVIIQDMDQILPQYNIHWKQR